MNHLFYLPITLLFFTINSFSQDILMSHDYNISTIYLSNTNIRKKPSLDAEIIGIGKLGEMLDLRYYSFSDTVNGVIDVWKKVKHDNTEGYVWGPLISQSAQFKSQEFIKHSFRVWLNENNQIAIKLSEEDVYRETFLLPNTSGLKFYSGYSLGKTYNSNYNDVFVFYFGDYDSLVTKYYQWDGVKITPFNKQLKDNSFSRYKQMSGGVITENVVNLRDKPAINSKVVKVLGLGYKVNTIKYEPVLDSINGIKGYWNMVTHKNDTGFVWAKYIGYYSFESYKDKSLNFILKSGDEFKETILAVKNGKIIDSYSFNRLSNFIGAHSRGSMGLKNISEIIGVCYSGGSCGTTSGDVLIAFDGEKFLKHFTEAGVGDGGLSYGENVVFPSNSGGKEGVVSITTYDSESIDLPGDDNYESINRSVLTRNYTLNDDSLVEVYSDTKLVEKLLKKKFKNYSLGYFEKGDINGDGLDDFVAYARYSNTSYEAYDKATNKSLLVVLLNNKRGKYKVQSFTKQLVYHNENDPLTSITLIKNGFKVNIYFAGYYNEQTSNSQYEVTFKYDNSKQDFFMRNIKQYSPTNNGQWDEKDYKYKTKNIAFKDSYIPEGEY
jgi:hypothetical protein